MSHKKASTDPGKDLHLYSRIGMYNEIVFSFFNEDGSDYDLSTVAIELGVKRNRGDEDLITLTQASGITVTDNDVHIVFTESESAEFKERPYYWQLRRTIDSKEKVWLNGVHDWHNGKFDAFNNAGETITITDGSEVVTITIQEPGGGSVTLASLGETLEEAAADTPLNPDTFYFFDFVDQILKKDTWGGLKANFDPAGSASLAETAANAYTDSQVVGLWDDRGNFDASVNAYPSSGGSGTAGAILKGDIWTVSVGGTLPTALVVVAGDTVRALVDTPGNTQANWAIAENNIGYVPENSVNKATNFGTVNDTLYPSVEAVTEYAVAITNTAVAITDGAAITLTAAKHTLTTDEAAITITDSYAGDFLAIAVTLSGITAVTFTLSTGTSLGAYNGTSMGTNTIVISGAVSGDRIIISRFKEGSNYDYVAFNMGQ